MRIKSKNMHKLMDMYDVLSFDGAPIELRVFTDDGNLHISEQGVRYCIDIGQGIPKKIFLKKCHDILDILEIEGIDDEDLLIGR